MPASPESWAVKTAASNGLPLSVSIPCQRCNRKTTPDMQTDISLLTQEQRDRCDWSAITYVCDGCMTHAHRHSLLTMEELVVAHGAPLDIIARVRAIDMAEGRTPNEVTE